jgi:hypothetical protein
MAKLIDLVGQKFGKLEVKSFHGKIKSHYYWNCLCECGNLSRVSGYRLRSGHTKSCGCLRKTAIPGRYIDGKRTREMSCWQNMIYRCYNPKNKSYKYYGGRGIQVCERWRDSFENFFEDMGKCPDGMSIERVDNDGNYEPSNCKWIPKKNQNSNRRDTVIITYNGETKTLNQWATCLGMNYSILKMRLRNWNNVEKAFTTPIDNYVKKINYNGEIKTILEWANYLNISYSVLSYRLTNWNNVEKAFITPVKIYKKKSTAIPVRTLISYHEETKNLLEWSRCLGINYNTLYTRLCAWGDVERTFTTPVKEKNNVKHIN